MGVIPTSISVSCWVAIAGVDWAREKGKTDKELVEEMRAELG